MDVDIERILPGGLGLAHAEGRTIMVPLAAPEDRLRVKIDREKGNVIFATIEAIIKPSPKRIEPPCPYFGRCGGCDFQQMDYLAQLDAKRDIIKDCLRRIGGIESIPEFQVIPSSNPWHYRARAQWQYDSNQKALGYFEAGSRRVCDVAECAVLVPELQAALHELRARMMEGLLPETARDFRAIAAGGKASVSTESKLREVTLSLNGETYSFNANIFFQTNVDLLPALLTAAINETGHSAIELYCGVGLFTLPLSRRFKQIIAIESDAGAASFAKRNLARAGLANATIVKADVGSWLEKIGPGELFSDAVDFLLLDPPRSGAESRVIRAILKLRPKHISYISCDPATLARDLKKLIAGNYCLDSIAAFDMFPQTHHVETVVHLSG